MTDHAHRRASTPRPNAGRRDLRDDDGLSIVELVAALSIFAILSTGIVATMITALDLTRTNRNRVVAANIAAEEMDRLRSLAATDFSAIEPGTDYVPDAPVLNGLRYDVDVTREWLDSTATQDPCRLTDGAEFVPRFIRASVTVTWPDMGGIQPVRSDTTIVPPVTTFEDAALGNVAVLLSDRDGEPLDGETVSLTAPDESVATAVTTADGCAVFNLLPPGDYAASVQKPGWVDTAGNAAATRSLGVQAGRITTLEITYDEAVSLSLTMDGGTGYPVPDGMWVTIANPGLPTSTLTLPGTNQTGPTRTVTNLFPFTDGYTAFAGRCLEADTTDSATPVAPAPGTTGSIAITMAAVEITVQDPDGESWVPAVGVPVTAVHDPAEGCPGGSSYLLGSTDADGVVRAALPQGLTRFEIPGYAVTGYPELQLTVGTLSTGLIRTGEPPPPEPEEEEEEEVLG